MKLRRLIFYEIVFIAVLVFLNSCKDNNETDQTKGTLTIYVSELKNNNSGIKAFIFIEDSLYGKTDEKGKYINNSVKPGNYNLTCSAIDFRDTSLQIKIVGGENTQFNFYLKSDSAKGKVFGEFQDMTLFRQNAINKPAINSWNERQVYDGTTGATMCYKFLQKDVPERRVSTVDSILAVSDGYGQYYFQIQCGTYVITGTCDGYNSVSKTIKVLPDSSIYANFYLEKK